MKIKSNITTPDKQLLKSWTEKILSPISSITKIRQIKILVLDSTCSTNHFLWLSSSHCPFSQLFTNFNHNKLFQAIKKMLHFNCNLHTALELGCFICRENFNKKKFHFLKFFQIVDKFKKWTGWILRVPQVRILQIVIGLGEKQDFSGPDWEFENPGFNLF